MLQKILFSYNLFINAVDVTQCPVHSLATSYIYSLCYIHPRYVMEDSQQDVQNLHSYFSIVYEREGKNLMARSLT